MPTYITDAADAERWRKSNAIQREQLEWYLSHQNEFAEELSHWRLLWQIQSNFRVGLNIGDAGEWNVLIRDSDLAKRDFDHVVAIPQGH